MHVMKATLNSDGQIQPPLEVQTQLGVKPGDEIVLEPQNGVCVLRAGDAPTGLVREGNVLVHHGVSESPIDAALDEVRKKRLHEAAESALP